MVAEVSCESKVDANIVTLEPAFTNGVEAVVMAPAKPVNAVVSSVLSTTWLEALSNRHLTSVEPVAGTVSKTSVPSMFTVPVDNASAVSVPFPSCTAFADPVTSLEDKVNNEGKASLIF